MMDEGRGVRVEGERLSVKEVGSGGELGSDLDMDPDPDPWKILWIWIHGKYYGSGSGKMMRILWIRIRNTASNDALYYSIASHTGNFVK